ncbi:MAG: hypothetical protein PHY93_13800 [Bacteriovorax sp.]|nr:hypothetical protein [Bacteriovorax sp.]
MNQKKYAPLALASVSCALLLSSCAGPESYQQKMARYEPKAISKNQVPDIKTADFKFQTQKNGPAGKASRFPASAPENPNLDAETKESNPTNKKLYFLALYSEYESIKNYSQEFTGPTVSICPNFHTGLLQHNDKIANNPKNLPVSKKFSYDATKYNDEMYVASRPELLLPLSKDEVTPKVIDVIKSSSRPMSDFAVNELIHKALDIHLAKTYSEIRELCEYGVSDNYYIYENLITHIKNNKFDAGNKNMNILLKTTIFSNIALMTSLDKHNGTTPGRSIASMPNDEKKNSYATEVMARLNVTWANQYFDYIKAAR